MLAASGFSGWAPRATAILSDRSGRAVVVCTTKSESNILKILQKSRQEDCWLADCTHGPATGRSRPPKIKFLMSRCLLLNAYQSSSARTLSLADWRKCNVSTVNNQSSEAKQSDPVVLLEGWIENSIQNPHARRISLYPREQKPKVKLMRPPFIDDSRGNRKERKKKNFPVSVRFDKYPTHQTVP